MRSHHSYNEHARVNIRKSGQASFPIPDSPFRRKGSYKHASSIVDELDAVARLFEVEDQVLRRILVRELESLFNIPNSDDQTLLDRLSNDIHSGQGVSLLVDLLLDAFEKLVGQIDSDEDDLRVDPVFSLREQVGCHEYGVGRLVSDDLSGQVK